MSQVSLSNEELLRRSAVAEVRVSAAYSLGLRAGFEAVDALIEALRDPVEEVRVAAAYSLGRLRPEVAIAALIQALYDPAFAVRSAAGWALVYLGEPAREAVLRVFEEDNGEAHEMALFVLERMSGISAIDSYRLALLGASPGDLLGERLR